MPKDEVREPSLIWKVYIIVFQHEQCMHNFLIIKYRYFVNVKYMSHFPSVLSVMFSPFFSPEGQLRWGVKVTWNSSPKYIVCGRHQRFVNILHCLFVCTCSVFHFKCFEMYHNLCLKLFKFTNCYTIHRRGSF